MIPERQIPEDHPVRGVFQTLTERGLKQSHLSDPEIHRYLSNLLVEFIQIENVYKLHDDSGRRLEFVIDMLAQSEESRDSSREDVYKHVGDFTLFLLGLFPESLTRGKRCISARYYASHGRRSYMQLWEMKSCRPAVVVFRKLSEQFEECVTSLNWVSSYIRDPFYQYMFREFDII